MRSSKLIDGQQVLIILKILQKRKNIIKIDNTGNIKIETPSTIENKDEMDNVSISLARQYR